MFVDNYTPFFEDLVEHRSSANPAMRSLLSVQGKIMTSFLTANLMIKYAAPQIF